MERGREIDVGRSTEELDNKYYDSSPLETKVPNA